MAGSQRTRQVSLLDAVGASYAAVAASVGLAVVLVGGSGLARLAALLLLAPLVLYFGRAAVVEVARVVIARRAHSLGGEVRAALASLDECFRVTRVACDEIEREDHVAIGPNGVFVIVAADGDRRLGASHRRLFPDSRAWWRDMIEDCHIEALRAGERLRRGVGRPLSIHPVLCLRSGLVTVGRVVRGVRIVHLHDLARTIAAVPAATPLDAREVDVASDALAGVAPVIPLRPRTADDRTRPAAARRLHPA